MFEKNNTPIDGAESTFKIDSITSTEMTQANLRELAAEIKRQDTKTVADKYFSSARKSGYICECGNGTGNDGTGAEIYFNAHHNRHELKCQKCGANFNNLEIIAHGEKLNLADKKDFVAAVKIGCEIYGLNFNNSSITAQKVKSAIVPTNDNAAELKLIHADIEFAQSSLSRFGEGVNIRGLNRNTLKYFGVGYINEWISPKILLEFEQGKRTKLPPPSHRFIVPTPNHYNAVLPELDREHTDKKYHKMHAGQKEIFGAEFLPINANLIIVVEGEFDAMSIWQATQGKYIAIATGGAADKRVVNFLQDNFTTHKPNILILFDSDDAGRLNAPKLREQLLKIGFPAVCKFLSDENSKIDANDILQNEGDEKLAQIISSIVADAQADFAAIKENFETIRADERATDKNFSADAQIDFLKVELQAVNKKLADFDAEKTAAIEKLQAQISFDKDSVFADDILNAAAFCKLYDKKTFSDFKAAIQNQIKSQGTEKFITEWSGEIRDRLDDIKSRRADLLSQQKSINAQIVSANFFSAHAELKDFIRPEGYEISNAGIKKIVGDKSVTVSRVPVVVQGKRKNHEEKTFKLVLAYLSENGAWQSVPATGEEIIFNARKLIDLRAYGLPVTSSNANLFVDYLDAFKAANEKILPMSLTVSRCGWHNFYGQDYFVEPRRKNFITDNDRNIEVVVEDSSFTKSLKSVGSLDEWRKAYDIAKKSPIARLIVAASIAAPLLKILGERNFVLYLYGTTRGGKSTCLLCGASAVGNTDMVISFDGTNNGLLGRAAETTDFVFCVDEKESADARLKDKFQKFVYSVANGKERQRANQDGSFKSVREWQNITICNGETELLDDNATGGAFTRLLQIHAPKTILAADDCKEIRRIIRQNYGHALPLVIDKIFDYGFDNLRENFNDACEVFAENFPNLLDDYRRYVAIMTLADAVLNMCLGVDEDAAFADAVDNAKIIFEFVPTIADISDFEREKDFLLGFIAAKSTQFEGTPDFLKGGGREILGKFDDDFVYITARALKQACDESHFDYKKVVADSIDAKFFIADEKIRKGRKTPFQFVQKKINGVNTNCYRIPKEKISDV